MATSFPGAAHFVPAHPSLPRLCSAVQNCRGCDFYVRATQAVLGEIDGERPSACCDHDDR